uniref:Protein transport protein Sec31A n=1 Tax=Cebus imitator TaxID=2715852 RepID=A0A2K5PTB7_CEBIM
MKLKEVDRTAMQAWSPAQNHPIYLATGKKFQVTPLTLLLFKRLLVIKFIFFYRYHKLIWGPYKMDSKGDVSGVLIAGGENGNIILYDPSKIIAGEKDVVIAQNDKHTGPVRALDVNIFQTNLVASGANESEIYIWDLNNFATPMTPGAKTQPPEDISCIAWNRQVQHILASASPSGRATVWDLRKNEPIIKVSDHSNRMHCSGLAWHPDVATQMVLASEDDRLPVIQMWDLRFASSPLRVLENHARGILAIAWSMADPELLLSCGKDAKILCSNPNTGEVLYELPTNTQWCFDIQWCPRNPAVLSAASFDGRISVYSIMGGSTDRLRQKQVDKLSSSFGNLDPFGTGQPLPPLQIPQQTAQHSIVLPLKKPPKWIRRPVGASFSFGGKLVTFENVRMPSHQGAEQQQQQHHHVFISQVVTEKEFLSRSDQLQQAVQSQGFINYCQKKIDASQTEFEKNVWSFLKVNFEDDSRGKYLELLGYRKEDLGKKRNPHFKKEKKKKNKYWPNLDRIVDIDGLITQALLTGNFESAVDLCLHDNRMADAIILAIAGGQELLARTQKKYFAKSQSKITRLITAVVMKNWKEIVESCDLKNWREALAAVLTYAKPDEFSALCDLLGTRLENEGDSLLQTQACLCYICAGNVEKLVACWTKAQDGSHPLSLQDLIEKVVVLRKAVQLTQATDTSTVGVLLAAKMSQYANLLAAQGSIAAALAFLPDNTNQPNIMQLRDRLCRAQGEPMAGHESPKIPYEKQQVPKGRPGSVAGHHQMPRVQAQQYYPHGENPPPPGFLMHGNVNPNAASQLPTSPGHMHTQVPPYPQPQRPQNGWNDPPALNRVPKKKKMPENFMPPVPITSPIMNPLGDPQSQMVQQQLSAPVPLSSQSSFPQPHLPGGQPFHGIQQPLGQTGMPPSFSKPNIEGAPGAPIGNTFQHVQSLPTEKITKKPIPDEHLILKTTFEDLIQRCLSSATDPQTRRKLDDASKRLELLYDKLREQTLSPTITSGLHNIARSIETRNYSEGLTMHTHIVSTSNFSETSAFMPVLKVVLTQANKLGV